MIIHNYNSKISILLRISLSLIVLSALFPSTAFSETTATQINIIGPAGSVQFGVEVAVLPSGNFVVTDPSYDGTIGVNAGAVYLYNGATGAMISALTGSKAGDQIGSGGVTVLSNGNYVVRSPYWENGATIDAGAVTWGSGTLGVSGVVSTTNSLVGSHEEDWVGYTCVKSLGNGNYVVVSSEWHNNGAASAGAVTWGNGTVGVKGVVSEGNSLVGSHEDDHVGKAEEDEDRPTHDDSMKTDIPETAEEEDEDECPGVMVLSNGNYVVRSPQWDSDSATDAGAVTWGSGTSGVKGEVSSDNSLVGTQAFDEVGQDRTIALSNGNYVVVSPDWGYEGGIELGAVTWGSGTSGVKGKVSSDNSLVGSVETDRVGNGGVTALSNGNYLVISPSWDSQYASDAGAVTWGSGASGVKGEISSDNSLVGSHDSDNVGWGEELVELSNGNYVVVSKSWDYDGALDAGAVTWGPGTVGVKGVVDSSNSLVGNHLGDFSNVKVIALSNGNYAVGNATWDKGGLEDVGAVTWGNGATGTNGSVSTSNSLVGIHAFDYVGGSVTALTNGNYVVVSSVWDNGEIYNVGAVTWRDGTIAMTGVVTTSNSLVGGQADDSVGNFGVTALANGNYVVRSYNWHNGGEEQAGAATWGNAGSGTTGVVSADNSLIGSHAYDHVSAYVIALTNGNYVVASPEWDKPGATNAGAVTWGSGTSGVKGEISVSTSLVGGQPYDSIGGNFVTALSNGNYVVNSPDFNYESIMDVGAVTWGSGTIGVSGVVSSTNSLVGSTAEDYVGTNRAHELSNGSYMVQSHYWDGVAADSGAMSWSCGFGRLAGVIDENNSVLGEAASGGEYMNYAYDAVNRQLVVGRPMDNIVTLFRYPVLFLPVVKK